MRFWRSIPGWVLAVLYLVVYGLEYAEYLRNRGTWFADLWLEILVLPYVLLGRLVLFSPSFELYGTHPWSLVPAALFCAFLAYCVGAGIDRGFRWWRRCRISRGGGAP